MAQLSNFSSSNEFSPDQSSEISAARLLFVSNILECEPLAREMAGVSDLLFIPFEQLSEETLTGFDPDTVAMPLFSDDFDCLDVSRILVACEYTGRVLVFHPDIPRSDETMLEVSRTFPTLEIEFMSLPRDRRCSPIKPD